MTPYVSIITPVLADADAAGRLVRYVDPADPVELILVDGGPDPALDRLARPPQIRVLRGTRGRARQMNAGAAAAGGEWLLFLHADSQLPPDWLAHLRDAPADAVGGWFRFALDDAAWQARAIERAVAWRVRLLRLPYGDQGLFVRRAAFHTLGGFAELPLMEDCEFVRRLVRAGRTFEVPHPLVTSARRWRRDGWFRRSARNTAILVCYVGGVSPERLARWYSRDS